MLGLNTPMQTESIPTQRAATAGAIGVGLALGVGELLAGIWPDGIPSPMSAVANQVIDRTPGEVERFAIRLFGTSDKAALLIGITIISLGIGAWVGVRAVRSKARPWPWFLGFAALGMAASQAEPQRSVPAVILAGGFSAFAGLVGLAWLLGSPPQLPADGLAKDPGRRRFLIGATGISGAALLGGVWGRRLARPTAGAFPVATRPAPPLPPGGELGIPGLTPIVVPNRDFYRIDTAITPPRVNADDWVLTINGMVDRPLTFDLAQLAALDQVEEYITLSCVSNEVGGDLVGNARWRGVRLAELLERAELQSGATQVVGRSVDGWTAGFPTEAVFDGREPMLALEMNGEPLPPSHGFPARLVVPGLYGYVSATKWLKEIKLTRWEDFDGYWIPRGWSKEGPIKTQSRIDLPRNRAKIGSGPLVVAGVAWAPLKGVERVEVRLDEGPWRPTQLSTPLSSMAWVQWTATLQTTAGRHTLEVRATDGTGYTQTAERSRPDPNGATGHHTVSFEAS